jgi:hypothetical protein
MITAPGAAMMDGKLFVGRPDAPHGGLYERFFDGVEWIWVEHGRPADLSVTGAPGAAMLDEKLFVVVEDGALWERHWRSDLGRWVWQEHGRPENRRISYGPGAAMMNEKLFVVTDDGSLWERHWRVDLGAWVWNDHGRPQNRPIVQPPGAAMMNEKLFVVTSDGALWERHWRVDLGAWVWNDHGRPANTPIAYGPGAAMLDEKLFVVTNDGHLWERHWRSDLGSWVWNDHGRPGGVSLTTAPGAAMMNSKLFVGGSDGHLWERVWDSEISAWDWEDHGLPAGYRVATTPGAAMLDSKLFVGTDNGHLVERVWTGSAWDWEDHGTPFADNSAHVIGAPGSDPKLTVAVMGDGFAEGDMEAYRSLVAERVVAAFGLDQLGANRSKVRLIRIDVVSPVSGVTERDYDQHGTDTNASDDTLSSETFRTSRLGFISTGIWSHCWIESTPSLTFERVENLRVRFAPDATNVIVLLNNNRSGGCNGGSVARFTSREGATTIAHELGHNLFQLGDEYHEGNQTFTGTAFAPNLSEQPSSWSMLKWSSRVAAGTPLPTDPGNLPSGWNNNTSVGAFEGGGGNFANGIFRPVIECRMNQNNPPWCPVCGDRIAVVFGAFP